MRFISEKVIEFAPAELLALPADVRDIMHVMKGG